MSYITNLRNEVVKAINLPIFNSNTITMKRIRRIINIENTDKSKIVFISNILNDLHNTGVIKPIENYKNPKQYRRIKIIEK